MIPTLDNLKLDILHIDSLPPGKALYFASDFHLGAPNAAASMARERLIVKWLKEIAPTAHSIFLVGDVFDFWFEYRNTVPKGYMRLFGALAEAADAGIKIYFFKGNHDMWLFDYFPNQLDATIISDCISINVGQQKLLVGHGDGLGPGDKMYKLLKWFFRSRLCQGLFSALHPTIGMGIANAWSGKSRLYNDKRAGHIEKESEWLYRWCKEVETATHHDYYVFGHRHLPLQLDIPTKCKAKSTYINLGEWLNHFTFLKYDGKEAVLNTYADGTSKVY